jgi:hypothetical protein
MPARLSKELVELIEGGVSIQVGTRDATLRPECLRAMGVSVGADRSLITVYAPVELAARTLANLEDNGRVAVTFAQVSTHRTLQVKGRVLSVRRARKNERGLQERYVAAFAEALHLTGFSRRIVRRMRHWPSLALEVEIEDLFVQTPGPQAGKRIEGAP